MKLVASLLLITLALCCYDADATPCPEYVKEANIFILGTESQLRLSLAKFNAPPESVEAKIITKRCVDKMDYADRERFAGVLKEIVGDC
ncbi:secretoglobin family 1D member 2-like [Ochotona curzoniae]|uniref:secretoglobin family 1D member 2-like n=1 Tax=Ochotona curzoniae TaxID=130825 RepID=UPI001B34C643|nr:secretoglobin family 1D member 2-like [Ochotona curzoniae]